MPEGANVAYPLRRTHARTVLIRTSESVSVSGGRLALGTWQAIYLCEHRARAHRRQLVVHAASV